MIAPEKPDLRKTRDRSKDKGRSRLFTEISVTKMRLAKDETEATFRDRKAPGLLLRLKKSGAKGWRAQYYDKAEQRMRTEALGEFAPGSPSHMSVKDARNAAMHHRANLEKILGERRKEASKNHVSFKAVSDWYFATYIEGQRRSASQIKAIIKAILPMTTEGNSMPWEQRAFETISRAEVVELLDKITEDRGPRAADVTLATLRAMMRRYASTHKIGVKYNYVPVVVDGMARIGDPSKRAGTRTLTDPEIKLMFSACDGLGVFGNLCKVLLYTGQRRTVVATMRFADITDGLWEIPPEDETTGDPKGNIECVRLPKPVLDIVEAQRKLQINEFVFPASRKGKRNGDSDAYGSYSAFGQGKEALDEAMAKLQPKTAIPHWTLHDLRRSTATMMARLDIEDDHRERVLGHKIPGVKGVYNRYKYLDQRSEALRKIAALIGDILNPPTTKGGNVVTLRR